MQTIKNKILTAICLASISSSAFAYTVISEKPTNDLDGSKIVYYYLKCDSGASKTVIKKHSGLGPQVYYTYNSGVQYPTLDKAAKISCNE